MTEPLRLVVSGNAEGGVAALTTVEKALQALSAQAAATSAALAESQTVTQAGFARSAEGSAVAAAGMKEVGKASATTSGEVEKAGHHAEKSGEGFGKMAESIALTTAAFLGAGGLLEAIRLGTSALLDDQKMQAQTKAALASTGGVAGVTAGHLQALADSMEKVTGVSESTVRAGGNLLLMFTQVRDVAGHPIFDRTLKDSEDLALRIGVSLPEAAKLLGRALEDPVTGLGRLSRANIVLSGTTKEAVKDAIKHGDVMKAQEIILAAVERQVGGTADAYGKTFAGALERLRTSFSHLSEDIVGSFTPALVKASTWLQNEITALRSSGKFSDDLTASQKQLASALKNVIDFAQAVSGALGGWGNTIKIGIGLWAAWKLAAVGAMAEEKAAAIAAAFATKTAFQEALISTGWGALAVAAGAAAAYTITHWTQVKQWFASFWAAMKAAASDWSKFLVGVIEIAAYQFLKGFEVILQTLKDALGWIPGIGGKIKAGLQVGIDAIESFKTKAVKNFKAAGKDSVDAWNAEMLKIKMPDPTTAGYTASGGSGPSSGSYTTNQAWNQYFALAAAKAKIPLTPQNLSFLENWAGRENIDQKRDAFNLLGTTRQVGASFSPRRADGSLYNTSGVQSYSSLAEGTKALALMFQQSNFNLLFAALKSGDPTKYFNDAPPPIKAKLEAQFRLWSGNGYSFTSLGAGGGATTAPGDYNGIQISRGAPPTNYANRVSKPTQALTVLGTALIGGGTQGRNPAINFTGHSGGPTSNVNKNGNSYHYSGEALDIGNSGGDAALIDDWNFLYPRRAAFAELIWGPLDPKVAALTPGAPGFYKWGIPVDDKKTIRGHWDHIHVAFTGDTKQLQQIIAGAKTPSGRVIGVPGGGAKPPQADGGTAPKVKDLTAMTPEEHLELSRAQGAVGAASPGTAAFKKAAEAQIKVDRDILATLASRMKGASKENKAKIQDAINAVNGDIRQLRAQEKGKTTLQPGDLLPTLAGQINAATEAEKAAKPGSAAFKSAVDRLVSLNREGIKYLYVQLSHAKTQTEKNQINSAIYALKDQNRELISGAAGGLVPQLTDKQKFEIDHWLSTGKKNDLAKAMELQGEYVGRLHDAMIAAAKRGDNKGAEAALTAWKAATADLVESSKAFADPDAIVVPVLTDAQQLKMTKLLQGGTRTGLAKVMEMEGEYIAALRKKAESLEKSGDLKGAIAAWGQFNTEVGNLTSLSQTFGEPFQARDDRQAALLAQTKALTPILGVIRSIGKQAREALPATQQAQSALTELFKLPGKQAGLLMAGNIDLLHRPVAKLKDGSIATVKSFSIDLEDALDGAAKSVQKKFAGKSGEILLPMVIHGKLVNQAQAEDYFKKTGENLGLFAGAATADKYAVALHLQQAKFYGAGGKAGEQVGAGLATGPLKDMPRIAAKIYDSFTKELKKIAGFRKTDGPVLTDDHLAQIAGFEQRAQKQLQDALSLKPAIADERKQLDAYSYEILRVPPQIAAAMKPLMAKVRAELTNIGPGDIAKVKAQQAILERTFQIAPDWQSTIDAFNALPEVLQKQLRPQMDEIGKILSHPLSERDIANVRGLISDLGKSFDMSGAAREAEGSAAQLRAELAGITDEGLRNQIAGGVDQINSELGGIISPEVLAQVQGQANDLQTIIDDALSAAKSAVESAKSKLFGDVNTWLDKAYSAFDAQTNKLIQDAQDAFDATQADAKAAFDAQQATAQQTSSDTQTPEELAYEQAKAADDAAQALEDQANATQDTTDATNRLAEAQAALAEAEKGVNLERSKGESMEAYRRRVQDAQDARLKAIEDANKQIADANAKASETMASQTAKAAKQATEALKQAAEDSRKHADASYSEQAKAAEASFATQTKAAEAGLAKQKLDIESARSFEKEKMQDAINDELARWQSGVDDSDTAMKKIKEILGANIPDIGALGDLMGMSFYDSWNYALGLIGTDIDNLAGTVTNFNNLAAASLSGTRAKAAEVAKAVSAAGQGQDPGPDPGPSSNNAGGGATFSDANSTGYGYSPAPVRKDPYISTIPFAIRYAQGGVVPYPYASGGTVPGAYLGREDTVLAKVTPGERVLTRSQEQTFEKLVTALQSNTHATSQAWPQQKQNPMVFNFNGHVWDKQQLMKDLRDELSRLGIVTPGGIFGGRA